MLSLSSKQYVTISAVSFCCTFFIGSVWS